jgi:hypothetical protein
LAPKQVPRFSIQVNYYEFGKLVITFTKTDQRKRFRLCVYQNIEKVLSLRLPKDLKRLSALRLPDDLKGFRLCVYQKT